MGAEAPCHHQELSNELCDLLRLFDEFLLQGVGQALWGVLLMVHQSLRPRLSLLERRSYIFILNRTIVPSIQIFLSHCNLILKSDDQMLQIGNFLLIISLSKIEFIQSLLSDHEFLITFLEGQSEIILIFLHLLDEDLLVMQPFLQYPSFLSLPPQFELNYNFIIGLIIRIIEIGPGVGDQDIATFRLRCPVLVEVTGHLLFNLQFS